MEPRKQKEIEYYNKEAGDWTEGEIKESGSRGGFNIFDLGSYNFLRDISKDKIKGKKVLDYGCGTGTNLEWLALDAKEVVGIDLSGKSLEVAEKIVQKKRLESKINLLLMDCEKMDFPDNSFDVIFDGGTFSSLDLKNVLPELKRVLKSNGFVIGIETLGHNPLTNFKRLINKITGRRTVWAAEHIFKVEDLKKVKRYFNKIETHYFHLISWAFFPCLGLPGGRFILKFFEKVDKFFLFIFPFLKRYCFKIVFVFSELNK